MCGLLEPALVFDPCRRSRDGLIEVSGGNGGLHTSAVVTPDHNPSLAMGVVSIVMGFIPGAADVDTHITLLGIGLAALAAAALMKEE